MSESFAAKVSPYLYDLRPQRPSRLVGQFESDRQCETLSVILAR
jgi:hypothetical protein